MSIESVALLVLLATTSVFAMLGLLHASRQTIDLEEYMVSRDRFGSWMGFATLVAAAMGVWILFSPPEVGAKNGITGMVGYCIGSAAPLALFAKLGPRIRSLMPKGHSLNEFVLHRFGNLMYVLTLIIMVFYMFIYLAAELTAIAKAVQILAAVPLGWTALVVITATFIYTAYGGLGATIFTDVVQFFVIVPLLIGSFIVALVSLGGWQSIALNISQQAPQLLSWSNLDGIKFGATLVVAIIAAETFNQSNWQRVYACRNNKTVKQAFLSSSLVILPMLLIAGSLGLMARNFGFDNDRAFFSLLDQLALPVWVVMLVLVLALALVMSTIAALLNGITSVFTGDLLRFFPQWQTRDLLRLSRILTVIIGIPAIAIAAQGFDVLYLFLLADLICAGALVPILYGFYSRRLSGTGAAISSLIGIAIGALFFPKPDYSAWINLPFAGDLLVSFCIAVIASTVSLWLSIALSDPTYNFDFDRLQQVRSYAEVGVDEAAIETGHLRR